MRLSRNIVSAGMVSLFALATAPVTWAQGAPQQEGGVTDIVVTATKTGETRLQATPLAVTALTADDLAKNGVRDVQDLKGQVPSLQVSDLSGYTQLYVRGVGSNSVFIGSDPSTTIHLDGIYLARPLSYLNGFLDVERVEVLRGPQGTIYGRNSVGGTINIVSRKPSTTLTGEFQGQYGSYDRYAGKGYISGPIGTKGIAASLAFDISGHDAFRKNVSTGNDAEDLKSRGLRAQLRFPLGPDGSFTVRGDYARQSGAMGAFPKLIRPVGVPLDDSILNDPGKVSMDQDNHTVLENYGASGELELGVAPGIRLRSLTAWRGFSGSIRSDADSSSLHLLRNQITPIRQDQISQEINLIGKGDAIDWVLGAFYFSEINREPLTLSIYPFGASHIQRPRLAARSFALFGQGEYHLTDTLSLIAGLRFTTERKHYQIDDYYTASVDPDPRVAASAFVLSGIPGLPDPFTVDASRSDQAWTPKIGITYKPSDTVMLYASATRGFKSGGFDYGSSTAADAARGYGPEKLWSFEGGLKSDLLDRRLRFNLTGFYYDYTDLQVQSYVQIGASFGAITQNAATARVKGVEVEIVAKPVGALQLTANMTVLDARYRDYPTAYVPTFGTFDASGNRLNNAPRFSATFGADYSIDLAQGGAITIGGDVHTQSTVYFTAANDGALGVSDYAEQQKGYAVLNARIGWTSVDKRWSVNLIGTNVTDRNYIVATANYTPAISARQGRPREIFGQIGYKF